MAETFRALGLMSGTSLDGIDAALIATDGERVAELGPSRTFPYAEEDRKLLRRALQDAAGLTERGARPGALAEAEAMVTRRHAEAVEAFLAGEGAAGHAPDVVGFHGQTVFHDPARQLTVQIGDGQALSDRLGLAVVWDFRADDVAAGGQGAPLAPVYHRALFETGGLTGPVAFLNIGGVANVTYVDAAGGLIAFDTGPGNALLDDWMQARRGLPFDKAGAFAAGGTPSETVLAALLAHPYFFAPPPKSLDRNDFSGAPLAGLSDADGAATLLHLTARSVAAALAHLPAPPQAWLVCGGGRHNCTMMQALSASLAPAPVQPVEALGYDGDAVEAQAFAFMAVRSLRGLPLTFPGTTGVAKPLSGGRPSRPKAGP